MPGLAGGLAVPHQAGLWIGSSPVGCQLLESSLHPAVPSLPPTGSQASSGTSCPQKPPLSPTSTRPLHVAPLLQQRLMVTGHSATAVSPHGELQGWGESHLFDIEQQQQLQHLHSWQERSEENAQPGSRGEMSLPGPEPQGRQRWAQLQHPQGSWEQQIICQQRKEPQKAETSHQVRVCP